MALANSAANRAINFLSRWATDPEEDQFAQAQAFWEQARVDKAYYDTEFLYRRIRFGLQRSGATSEQIANVRSPVFRAVEFHVGHIWPGSLPGALGIKGDSPLTAGGRKQVYEILKASNFTSKKQVLVRTAGWSGNAFIKVPQRQDKSPYLQIIRPQYVREFEVDDRGHLTYLRTAIPEGVGRGANRKIEWVTEVMDLSHGSIRTWRKEWALDDYENEEGASVVSLRNIGIDFLPVVWSPFVETEPGRGIGVFQPFREKIDNANRAATRLDDMLFRYNRPVWAMVRSNTTPEGYEMPPVEMEGSFATNYTNLSDEEYEDRLGRPRGERLDDGTMAIGNDTMLSLPSGVTPQSLVPTVDYTSALGIVNAHMDELAQDMPELLYTKALDSAARDSSKVLEIQLAGAIDRAKEARGNLENALVRSVQIAITLGQRAKIPSYVSLGRFEEGALDFEFEDRPVVPPDPSEQADETVKKAQALAEKFTVLRSMGFSTEVLKSEVAALIGVSERELKEAAEGEAGSEAGDNLGSAESALQSLLSGAVTAGSGAGGRGPGGASEEPERGQNPPRAPQRS